MKKNEVFCATETNTYFYTAISAHRRNTELSLTPMNSDADVCVFVCVCACVCVTESVWVVVSFSMDVLSLFAPLPTHCSLMFTQLFSTVSFSVEYNSTYTVKDKFIICMFKCGVYHV